jgi:hypothetical protein
MFDRYLIHTPAESQTQQWATLLSMLEDLLPVKFSSTPERQSEISGELLTANVNGVACHGENAVCTLSVQQCENASNGGELTEIAVRFSDDTGVPFPFRGRSLRTMVASQLNTLTLNPDERPLATCDLGPVWVLSEGEGAKNFRSGFALPVLPAEGSLKDVLNGQRFLEMLPVLHWLREICASVSDGGPPLRACFMFDDPNLHWPRYGFADYRQLATQAERENYHVSFATIPLDTWFTHCGTADIFRNHKTRLSLLVHGNNHTKRELARPYTGPERVYLLTQAIQRIERLERRSGLSVSRVMVPPHGACSEEMLAALPVCGFEAACISHGSLRAHNKAKDWTKTLGYLASELVRGCPVLPRWGVSGDLQNTILLAAFLKQAIILRGHHQDLKDGIELLDDLARFINGLGHVVWSNLSDLSRLDNQRRASTENCVPLPPRINGENGREIAGPSTAVTKAFARSARVAFLRRSLTEARDRFLL